ncbi:MAG: FkbM family methyltransferase [Actinobacteria bacterium]|nr:FkbM family methyltransferase [Actinomycetota bacterium]
MLLSVEATDRYWKASRDGLSTNEGQGIIEFLEHFGIDPSCIVDVGANFGEISMSLSRRFPAARVIAVEPSPVNITILRENLEYQPWSTQMIEVVNYAVTERDDMFSFEVENGSQDRIVDEKTPLTPRAVATVKGLTFSSLLSELAILEVSFLKVDIEGYEIKVVSDLMRNVHKIRSGLLELGGLYSRDERRRILEELEAGYLLIGDNFDSLSVSEALEYVESTGKDIFVVRRGHTLVSDSLVLN